jgi:hypothetical protein
MQTSRASRANDARVNSGCTDVMQMDAGRNAEDFLTSQ